MIVVDFIQLMVTNVQVTKMLNDQSLKNVMSRCYKPAIKTHRQIRNNHKKCNKIF